MSQRKVIRDKIKALLLGQTDAEDRIFTNRVIPNEVDELPVINIYTIEESSEIYNSSPMEYERSVTVAIEVIDSVDSEIDDRLDEMADSVEAIMHGDDTLESVASKVVYTGTQLTINSDGENLIGSLRLTYEITYYSYHGIDPTTLPDLETSVIQYGPDVDDDPDTEPVTYDTIEHNEE
jgi:hypothetical protein